MHDKIIFTVLPSPYCLHCPQHIINEHSLRLIQQSSILDGGHEICRVRSCLEQAVLLWVGELEWHRPDK